MFTRIPGAAAGTPCLRLEKTLPPRAALQKLWQENHPLLFSVDVSAGGAVPPPCPSWHSWSPCQERCGAGYPRGTRVQLSLTHVGLWHGHHPHPVCLQPSLPFLLRSRRASAPWTRLCVSRLGIQDSHRALRSWGIHGGPGQDRDWQAGRDKAK